MSSYFDDTDHRLREAKPTDQAEWDGLPCSAFEAIERKLVFDVTVAAALPGFPADLADAIHRVVLRYGVVALPDVAEPADFETDEEHRRRLFYLSGDLHSIFHEVGRRCWPTLSDNPRLGVIRVFDAGEERRIALAEVARWGDVRAEAEIAGLVKGPQYGMIEDSSGQWPAWWVTTKGHRVIGFDADHRDHWVLLFTGRHVRHEAEALRAAIEYRNHIILGAP